MRYIFLFICMLLPGINSKKVQLIPSGKVWCHLEEMLNITFLARWENSATVLKFSSDKIPFTLGYVFLKHCSLTFEQTNYTGKAICTNKSVSGNLIVSGIKDNDHKRQIEFKLFRDDMSVEGSEKLIIYVQAPLTNISITPVDLHLTNLERINITCITSESRPPARVTWMKKTRLQTNFEVLTARINTFQSDGNMTTSILEYSAAVEDSGAEIYCNATNGPKEVMVSAKTERITVYYGPERTLQLFPSINQIQLLEGETLDIKCSANCNPQCYINWITPSGARINGQRLLLKHITKSKAGKYSCKASNMFKRQQHKSNKNIDVVILHHSASNTKTKVQFIWIIIIIVIIAIAIVTSIIVRQMAKHCASKNQHEDTDDCGDASDGQILQQDQCTAIYSEVVKVKMKESLNTNIVPVSVRRNHNSTVDDLNLPKAGRAIIDEETGATRKPRQKPIPTPRQTKKQRLIADTDSNGMTAEQRKITSNAYTIEKGNTKLAETIPTLINGNHDKGIRRIRRINILPNDWQSKVNAKDGKVQQEETDDLNDDILSENSNKNQETQMNYVKDDDDDDKDDNDDDDDDDDDEKDDDDDDDDNDEDNDDDDEKDDDDDDDDSGDNKGKSDDNVDFGCVVKGFNCEDKHYFDRNNRFSIEDNENEMETNKSVPQSHLPVEKEKSAGVSLLSKKSNFNYAEIDVDIMPSGVGQFKIHGLQNKINYTEICFDNDLNK